MKIRFFAAFTALLVSASILSAQTARLQGRVLDPSGAVIPAADLKVTQGSRVAVEGKTNATGNFSFEIDSYARRIILHFNLLII